MTRPLSVTVLAGTPGADGSRVLERILQGSNDIRLTAIVPKRGRKRKNSSGPNGSLLPTTERLVRMGEGCACCTVRGDLMTKVRRIAEEGSADHVVIQTSPGADLTTVAKTFTVADGSGALLSDVAQFQNLASVIDARNFLGALAAVSARTLIERIELANVIVLEHAGSLSEVEQARVHATITALNSDIQIVRGDMDEFNIRHVQASQPFDLHAAQRRAMQPADDTSATRIYYQERRPFHPEKLHHFLTEELPGVLRATGSFWVATQPDLAGTLDVAGGSRNTSCSGMWWASVPANERPDSIEFRHYMKEIWHPQFGDRHQDLSILGIGIDEEELRGRLDQCLVTDEELAAPDLWKKMTDPFKWPKGR